MRLARTPRVGPVTFFQLLSRFKTATRALDALPSLGRKDLASQIPDHSTIEREWDDTIRFGARFLFPSEPNYPTLLKQYAPPPPVLTVMGDLSIFEKRCVAIVGARQASAIGRKLARDISSDLSRQEFAIVSGLARGIDGEAHAAGLEGGTIAVLAGGIDHIYPPQHDRLYAAIRETGILVSESPFGHRATARDFPRRNRIVTGLCERVVVIEAAERSGSLISARTALEQNREVMAVPGSPLEPRSAGGNRLLKDGATLVRNADDVIEALSRTVPPSLRAPAQPEYSDSEQPLGRFPEDQMISVKLALSFEPASIEDIARAAEIGVPRCAAILVELELSGEAVTYSGGRASLSI